MKFKDDIVKDRFQDLAKEASRLAIEMDEWSVKNYGLELTLTETVSTRGEDTRLLRVSDTHRTRRAFDVRVKDLPESLVAELCSYFRKKYTNLGALTPNQRSLIVYKPHGTGPHLHVQLDRKYALPEISYGGQDGKS